MDIVRAAEKLMEAEKTKKTIAPLTSSTENLSVEDAYGIQLYQIQQKLEQGAKIKGWKIGLTSKAMQTMLNVYTPDYGCILDTMIYEEKQAVSPLSFIQPKVEFEVAFFLKTDLLGPNVTFEDVMEATDYVVPSIEIIDSRIADWQIKFEDTVADNGSSAGALLGNTKTSLTDIDLASVEMKVFRNGDFLDEAKGEAVLGNPINAVVWLANELSKYDISLQKGMFILSGALSKAVEFSSGDEFTADFGPMGQVSISFQEAEVIK